MNICTSYTACEWVGKKIAQCFSGQEEGEGEGGGWGEGEKAGEVQGRGSKGVVKSSHGYSEQQYG